MALFSKPVRLTQEHRPALANFDCGERTLDLWLKTKALANEMKGGSRTFVTFSVATGELAGFFSLASHAVKHEDLKAKLRRNMPAPLPAILLGRLAVAKKYQGLGVGASLLSEAVRISQLAADAIGVSVLVVHPISEQAAAFYVKHGFSTANISKEMLFLDLHRPAY